MAIEDRAPQLRAVAIFNLVIAVVSMGLRVYARGFLGRTWRLEDWLMTAAFCTFLPNITTCLLGLHYGTGKHMADLSPYNIEKAMMFWWACYPTFIVTMILSKCSIGVFLNRITTNRIHHWIMYTAMFLTALTGVAFFFIAIFQCSPVNYWWKQVNPAVKGHCINIRAISNVTYAYSAVSILTDFIFAFLPIHIVMGLHMDTRTKLALVPIFAMATLASIACVIRLAYIPKFTAVDFLWNTADVVIWSETEQGLAITAGNLATCRPLLRLTVEKFNTWTGRSTRNYSRGSEISLQQRSTIRHIFTPNTLRRKFFRAPSFSKEIEVHTDVNVHREKSNVAEAYTDVHASSAPKKKSSSAWLDSTVASRVGDSDDDFPERSKQGTYYNAV